MLAVVLLTAVVLAYLWVTIKHGYWKRRKVPGPPPTFFGGNIGPSLTMKKSVGDCYIDHYRKYRDYPFIGIYKIFSPALLVIDPEIVRDVLVKDFSKFSNNTISFSEDDLVIGQNPFNLKGQKWKTARQKVTPLFSISKVKPVVTVFNDSGVKLVNYVKRVLGRDKNAEFVAKDLAGRFAASNVATWGLALDAKCFEDETCEFLRTVNQFFSFTGLQGVLFMLSFVFPSLTLFFKIRFASPASEKSFRDLVTESVRCRTNDKNESNDFVSTLLKMRDSGTFTDRDVMAHLGELYTDGVETSAVVLHYILYELAAHQHAQEELYTEINDVLRSGGGDVAYEAMQEMKYLDAVMNESIRLHFAVHFFDRQTSEKTKLTGTTSDGKQIEATLDVGTSVIIPVSALHLDEKYFPDPLAFKPERFLPENRHKITKFTFLPFGEGPRICLGRNFGISQVKNGVIHIVRNFKLTLGDSTPYPIEPDPTGFLVLPKNPIKIKLHPRE